MASSFFSASGLAGSVPVISPPAAASDSMPSAAGVDACSSRRKGGGRTGAEGVQGEGGKAGTGLQRPQEGLNAEARGVEAHLGDDAPGAAIIERLTERLGGLCHATTGVIARDHARAE